MSAFEMLVNVRPLAQHLTRWRRWVLRGIQFATFLFAGISAFLLRFDLTLPSDEVRHLLVGLCVWAVVKPVVFHLFGLDRGWWRYTSVPDLLRLGFSNVVASALSFAGIFVFSPPGFPRSVHPLDFLLCFGMTAGIRLASRVAFESSRIDHTSDRKRALIYGAGDAGVSLLREIHQNAALAYDIIGFIDDNSEKIGTDIHGARIFGNGEALPAIVKAHGIDTVLIAMPSATGSEMTAILRRCYEAGVSYKTVPGLADLIESGGIAAQIRDVAVEDLLGRNPVQLDESGIRAKVEGRVVAVTGAAGSIGSELCRQIARFHPAAIVAYDCSETALFHIDRELREHFPKLQICPEIGDIRNPQRLDEVFGKHRPSILYHAAAYKHVPMMEDHLFEAIENNVIGTWNVAAAAATHGVTDFVMISSDKAVRPTNIMGVTKRVAELLIRALQEGSATKYVSVRFGNVLGSNGSVIPLFKQQIAARKAVTVTHPEMRRYFMTIPEAAQLVIQASTMGHGGEIFVLDMGRQVRIVDLAHNLILLSGLRPEVDIKIEFTGIRPGEKLYEELAHGDELTLATPHHKIKIFAENGASNHSLERIAALKRLCGARDFSNVILLLKDLIPDYNPSAHVLRQVVPVSGADPEKPKSQSASAGT